MFLLKIGKIMDDTRILAVIPTIKHILDANASIILMSHLGRPKGFADRDKFSLKPVADRLAKILARDVKMAPECVGESVKQLCDSLLPGDIVMLENTRFHPEETGEITKNGLNEAQITTGNSGNKNKTARAGKRTGKPWGYIC